MTEMCITCAALPKCKKATPEMIILLEGCRLHAEAEGAIINARIRAVDLFGPAVVTKTKGTVDMEIVGSRKYLRAIAVASGATSMRDSFSLKDTDLVNVILSVKDDAGNPRFPEIASMDDAALKDLSVELKNGGAPAKAPPRKEEGEAPPPATKKPRKAHKRKDVKEDPPDEEGPANESDDSSETEDELPALRKPAKKRAPSPRAPQKKAAPPPASKDEVSSGDVSALAEQVTLLVEMVKTIGGMMDKQAEAIALLQKESRDLQEALDRSLELQEAADQHLAWAYSLEVAEGNEITSLLEISWK